MLEKGEKRGKYSETHSEPGQTTKMELFQK